MSTDTMTATQVYRVYIKTTPQQIWDAITKPEWTERYGYTKSPTSTYGRAASTRRTRARR
jgi:uncharacterized protein YndB with AHSA1/START domain